MSKRPQFSLKAILAIVAVLAVPLALMVSGDEDFALAGSLYGLPVLLACIGYLLIGWGVFR